MFHINYVKDNKSDMALMTNLTQYFRQIYLCSVRFCK